jgi:hypothetical protein
MISIGQIKTNPAYKPSRSYGGRSRSAGGKHDTEIVFGHVIIALFIWHFVNATDP